MTSLRIAFTELERILSGRLARLAVVAMAIIPALYAGLYLYANHDPYAELSRVPAALVVLDDGAEGPDGTPLNAGDEVAAELVDAAAFDWQEVDADEAEDGVEEGRYDFALTIPADFSAALTSSSRFEPRQARLQMTTNDANSYLSTTIADRVTGSVRDAIAERVGEEAAGEFLLGLSQIRDDLADAADGAAEVRAGAAEAAAGSRKVARGADRVAEGARRVAEGNREVAATARSIARASSNLNRDYQTARLGLIRRMAQAGLSVRERQYVLTAYDFLGQRIRRADGYVQGATADLTRLSAGADRVASGARRVSRGTDDLHGGLVEIRSGSGELATGLRDGVREIPSVDDQTRGRMAETIGDPVEVSNVAQTEADSYGAGLAPFFLPLAAWIGGYALFLLVRPLSHRAMAANQTPLRVAVGGWLTPALVGAVQMALLFGVVLVAIDIVPENIPLTLGFLLLASAAFVAIVHCLVAWFGPVGQFLGLVLLVLQLVSAGGTFPWQTLPESLHWLHYALPMSYAVDGLRQLMYGGVTALAGRDALVLLAWLVGALVLTAVAARRKRVWSVDRIRPELAL